MKKILILAAALLVAAFVYDSIRPQAKTIVRAADASKWTSSDAPLVITHDDKLGLAAAQGFWQPTDANAGQQALSPITAVIRCTRYNRTCAVSEASVVEGVLRAQPFQYYISHWTADSITADDYEEGPCGLHRYLALDLTPVAAWNPPADGTRN